MKYPWMFALVLAVLSCAARAQAPVDAVPMDQVPTEESIDQLLTITSAEGMIDAMLEQMEQGIRQGMNSAIEGKSVPPQAREALDRVPAKIIDALRSELGWEVMKPVYVAVYKEQLTQAEVDGMIAFYSTPVGQATIRKMPALMQRAGELTQARLQAFMPKVQAAIAEAFAEAGVDPQRPD